MYEITLENFRCFRRKQTARLAPLTLLVGENSTGKTSFLALIRALRCVAFQHRVPDFKEEPYDLGSFDEIAHHRMGKGGRAEIFSAGFEFKAEPLGRNLGICRFDTDFGKKGTVPYPVCRRLSKDDYWVEYNLQQDGSELLRSGVGDRRWQVELPQRVARSSDEYLPHFDLSVSYLISRIKERDESDFEFIPLVDGIDAPTREEMDRFITASMITWNKNAALYASAPVRSKPRRTYDPARPSRDPEGDYIPMYLADVYVQDRKHWKSLKRALEKFGEAAGLFNEISVAPLGKNASAPFQIQVRRYDNKAKGPRRNLIDVGYGVSQALPLVTELLRHDAPPIFLLQQPEVHLHPSAQAALGTLFCQVASPDRQLIVETHSDHLLDRVRMDVRDGTTGLKPDDVSILFFERGDLDVRIHSLRIDKEGNILGAPDGYRRFFMEETNRSIGL